MRECAWGVLCLIGLTAGEARGELYRSVDERGLVHLTNVPPANRAAQPAASRPKVPAEQRFAPLIEQAARQHGVQADLIRAVIGAESAYEPMALSPKGAAGLMQLMPATARRYGVKDVWDPAQNIHGGARYLGDLISRFGNDVPLALAAYNAGEAAVLRHGGIPPYAETKDYVFKVLRRYGGGD